MTTIKEMKEELEMLAYMRTLAGKEGRGRKIYPKPTPGDDSRCITVMSVLLLNVMDEVKELQRSNEEQKTAENKSLFTRFTKFCKNIIQKSDNNLLIFGTLLITGFTFGIISPLQIIFADVK